MSDVVATAMPRALFPPRRSWLVPAGLGTLCFALWSVLPKLIGPALSAQRQQMVSTLGLLPVLGGLLFACQRERGERPRRGFAFAAAAGLLTGAGNLAYYAVASGPHALSQVAPLTSLYPVVTVILGALWLKERWTYLQAIGLLAALGALVCFTVADATGPLWQDWRQALVPLMLWGSAGVLQKRSTADASGEWAAVGFLAAFVPFGAVLWAIQSSGQAITLVGTVSAASLILAALLGTTLALGNLFVLQAFRRQGPASLVTPLAGLYWVFAVPVGVWGFHEPFGSLQGWALALTFVSVVVLTRPASSLGPTEVA